MRSREFEGVSLFRVLSSTTLTRSSTTSLLRADSCTLESVAVRSSFARDFSRKYNKNQIAFINKATRCNWTEPGKLARTNVVGDTVRWVKRATDEYVGPGTYRWGVLHGGV